MWRHLAQFSKFFYISILWSMNLMRIIHDIALHRSKICFSKTNNHILIVLKKLSSIKPTVFQPCNFCKFSSRKSVLQKKFCEEEVIKVQWAFFSFWSSFPAWLYSILVKMRQSLQCEEYDEFVTKFSSQASLDSYSELIVEGMRMEDNRHSSSVFRQQPVNVVHIK